MKHYLVTLCWLIWKELKCEYRRKEIFPSMLVFSLVMIILFHFSLSQTGQFSASVTAGIIWIVLAFAGTLGLNRSVALDMEEGRMDGLLLAPADHSVFYLSKLLLNWLAMLLVAGCFLPIMQVMYSVRIFQTEFIIVVLLGTLGYSICGNILAGMAMQTRMRDTMLSILFFPVIVPLLLMAVKVSSGIFQQMDGAVIAGWIRYMVGFDVIFFAIGLMTYPMIIEE